MRESRTAISSRPLPDFVIKNFIRILSPYRRRNQQVLQLGFYIIASSILAKSPLLREAPVELDSATHRGNFMHDILVLSSRVAKTEEGARAIRSGDFTRYFHYVVGITSLNEHLHVSIKSMTLFSTELYNFIICRTWRIAVEIYSVNLRVILLKLCT